MSYSSQNLKARLISLAIGCIVGFCVAEGVLRIWFPRTLEADWRKQIQKLQMPFEEDSIAAPRLVEATLHHVNQVERRTKHELEGFHYSIKTNSQGIRSETELVPEKTKSTRILMLGDSFTFGLNVSDQETYPAQLEKILNQNKASSCKVVNFGVVSYSPLLMLQQYRKTVKRFDNNLIIINFDNSDVYDDFVYTQEAIFDEKGFLLGFDPMVKLLETAELRSRQEEELRSASARFANIFTSRFHFAVLLKNFMTPEREYGNIANDFFGHFREGVDWSEHWTRSSAYLKQLVDEIRADKKNVCLVYYPYPLQVSDNSWGRRIAEGFKVGKTYPTKVPEWLAEFSRMQNVPFLDTTETFRKRWNAECSFNSDFHYRPYGYGILAESVAEFILSQNLIQPIPVELKGKAKLGK